MLKALLFGIKKSSKIELIMLRNLIIADKNKLFDFHIVKKPVINA